MSSGQGSEFSMEVLKAAGVQLATREVAVGLAELLLKSSYGADELEIQRPLIAKDGGDRWIIEGSRRFGQAKTDRDDVDFGKIEIVIAKSDCRILKFIGDAKIRSPN